FYFLIPLRAAFENVTYCAVPSGRRQASCPWAEAFPRERRHREMELINAKSIFNPATGFILRGGFAWTCNPYVGCSFGCAYCYAAFLPQNRRPVEDWGKWFVVKKNAVEVARKQAKKVAGQTLYMSSVTDPYMPVERSLCLTRGILEELVPHQPRLLVQTR